MSLHTDQCHILKTFSETWAMLMFVIVLHGQKWRYKLRMKSGLLETELIITHFYLPFFPCLVIKTVQRYMPKRNKRNDCPLQAFILVQRSSASCFLCLSICFPQMPNTGHALQGPANLLGYHILLELPSSTVLDTFMWDHSISSSASCLVTVRKKAAWYSGNASSSGVRSRHHYPLMACDLG